MAWEVHWHVAMTIIIFQHSDLPCRLHWGYRVTWLSFRNMVEKGRNFDNPLVSLLLTISSAHKDNTLWWRFVITIWWMGPCNHVFHLHSASHLQACHLPHERGQEVDSPLVSISMTGSSPYSNITPCHITHPDPHPQTTHPHPPLSTTHKLKSVL